MQAILDILGNIGFDWPVALANFVNFLIIFYILKRFAFGPISKVLSDRRKKIEQGLTDAKKAETSLMMAEEERKRIVTEAEREGDKLITKAREAETAFLSSARDKGKEEVKGMLVEAHEQIASEKAAMRRELSKETADLVIASTEKVLREKMTSKDDEAFIKKVIAS